ncbi:MAG: hypothetical protein HZB22_02795 [Deltaproteobacteria bacterium]|nr:hypothetical protein [Deltaproteobacteria bacterium]
MVNIKRTADDPADRVPEQAAGARRTPPGKRREGPAKAALREAPGDRQIRFILERLEGK